MAARTVRLTGVISKEPSTGTWRVSAFDEQRGHKYVTGSFYASGLMKNLRELVLTQYPPDDRIVIVSNFATRLK